MCMCVCVWVLEIRRPDNGFWAQVKRNRKEIENIILFVCNMCECECEYNLSISTSVLESDDPLI